MTTAELRQQDFEKLLAFRVALRGSQRWSEDQAQAAGVTHVQHQLLVAIKGHPGGERPAIGDLAGYLLLRSHSTVELVDRAEAAGLVRRTPDRADGRVVRVRLTRAGDRIVQQLTRAHLTRLHDLAGVLDDLAAGGGTDSAERDAGLAGQTRSTALGRISGRFDLARFAPVCSDAQRSEFGTISHSA